MTIIYAGDKVKMDWFLRWGGEQYYLWIEVLYDEDRDGVIVEDVDVIDCDIELPDGTWDVCPFPPEAMDRLRNELQNAL